MGTESQTGNVVWVTRSFLDYRVPVYRALDEQIGGALTVVYNRDYVPERAQRKLRAVLGERAVGLHGERRVGPNAFGNSMANRAIRIPWQPGLLREISKREPAVLVSDGFFQWTTACLWLRARYGIPHVMCYERWAHTERNAQWYRRLYRKWALRYIDAICCSGRLCGEYTQSLGFPAERITYGHMVADVDGLRQARERVTAAEREALRARHGLRGTVFLYVGRLVRMKGIAELLRAWAEFAGTGGSESATLALVGDGPERQPGEEYCQAKGLDSVRFLGAVDYDRLAPYYAAADVFVIPTLEDNWSLVVPEAMACGLPVLCSRYNGCWPELVQEGRNGWVLDPLDTPTLAGLLGQITASQGGLAAYGAESSATVSGCSPVRAAAAISECCGIARRRAEERA